MNIKKKIFAILCLILLFAGIYNIAFFSHFHRINGQIVFHTHPYSDSNNRIPNHTHTNSDLTRIEILNSLIICSLTAIFIISAFHQVLLIQFKIKPYDFKIENNLKSRAPPSFA